MVNSLGCEVLGVSTLTSVVPEAGSVGGAGVGVHISPAKTEAANTRVSKTVTVNLCRVFIDFS